MAILEFQNITRLFPSALPGAQPRAIFENLSLTLDPGETIALIGPSGAGKTTLLYLAAGLARPTRGRVVFDGRDLAQLASGELARLRRESIALVFQNNLSLSALPVWENVALPMLLRGVDKRTARGEAERLLALVGLGDWANGATAALSGGQRQRMGIARAMATRPKLLLGDEPTADLDVRTAARVEAMLFEWLAREKIAALLVTHSATVEAAAGRVMRLDEGRIAEATPAPTHLNATLRSDTSDWI